MANGKSWKEAARSASGGQYLKFQDGDDVVLKVLSEPEYREFTNAEGRVVKSWEWRVLTEDGEKVMSVASKRLLEELADADDEEPLLGRWIRILAKGNGYQRKYRVRAASAPEWARETKRFRPVPDDVDLWAEDVE